MKTTRYDNIGRGYSDFRREDPVIKEFVASFLGGCNTVANIGAGSGLYEPNDRLVVAVEPSLVMAQQRSSLFPAIRANADSLPFFDASFDAAMTILSLHHWHPLQEAGVREMRRISKSKVIVITVDPEVSGNMWLMKHYFPEVAELDRIIFPSPEKICDWLDCDTAIHTIPIDRDSPDWTLMSYWAHPERVLDPLARMATSGFARQPEAVVERIEKELKLDLESGDWDLQHGELRKLNSFDAGLRAITAEISGVV